MNTELPRAKILRCYKNHGVTYTEVRCPFCGRVEIHGTAEPEGEIRYSHCGGAVEGGRYLMTYHAETAEPLASQRARYVNAVLSGKLPAGLNMSEFGFQIDTSICPPDSDRFSQLSRLIDALESYEELEL